MLTKNNIIKTYPIKSAVIIANPKTIINKTKCPKQIQSQLYKYDQLTVLLKKELDKYKDEMPAREKLMFEIAEFLLANNKPISFDNISKYSLTDEDFAKNLKSPTPNIQHKQQTHVVQSHQTSPTISAPVQQKPQGSINIEETEVYKALKEYRLKISKLENIKPYYVYNNDEMECIIHANPNTKEELLHCKGFGEKKYEKYGESVLEILKRYA